MQEPIHNDTPALEEGEKEAIPVKIPAPPSNHSFFSGCLIFFRKRFVQAVLLFLCLWIIYNSNARLSGGSDCYAARFLPINLVLYHSYHYDNLTFLRGADGKGGMPGGMVLEGTKTPSEGHLITFYPVLIPSLLVPFYYIPFKILKISPESYWPFYMDKWFMAAFVAGAAVFLFLALDRVKVRIVGRLLLTISFALGTSAWAISSQAFWQHAPSQFFLALSLYLLLRLKETDKWIGPIGLVCALGLAARPSNMVWFCLVGLYIFLYLLREKKKWWLILSYFIWAMPVAMFLLLYNTVYFGSPFTSGYDFNPVNRYIVDYLHIHNFPAGFRGLLLSTSLGLLPNAPFFIFIIPAFILGLRKHSRPALGLRRLVWIFVVFHILLYSCYREWWGGFSFAYRYLTDIMPFLCFLLFPLVSWKPFRLALWPVYGIFLFWAMAIQFYGAFLWSGVLWYGPYWQNLTQQLLVNKQALKQGKLFGKRSVHWSLNVKEHCIGVELEYWYRTHQHEKNKLKAYFRDAHKWFLSPKEMISDLSPKNRVTYGQYSPIILIFGQHVH